MSECCESENPHDESGERQPLTISDALAADLAETFQVLADANRVRMVAALADGELCVGDLAGIVGMSVSAVSHQLRRMRQLGIVRSRRAGRHIYYALDDEHIDAVYRQSLSHVRHRQQSLSLDPSARGDNKG